MQVSELNEVSKKQDAIDKNVKKIKKRIHIPNATIKHYHYRFEQDTANIQPQESDAIRSKTRKVAREKSEEKLETITEDFIIKDLDI